MKKILGPLRKAIEKYDMIKADDAIAVGLSGGKDSTALLVALKRFQFFSPVPFSLKAITLDLGFKDMDFSPLRALCADLNIPYTIKKTDIGEIIFETRREKNPCSLCSRMKRGALHDLAIEEGCRKIAFGHHHDDVIQTFFLSLFYESRINTFAPVTYLDRKDISLIRPLIFVKEKDILSSLDLKDLPIIESTCPADGYTKRDEMKDLIENLKKTIPDVDERILSAIQNKEQFKLWF